MVFIHMNKNNGFLRLELYATIQGLKQGNKSAAPLFVVSNDIEYAIFEKCPIITK